MTGTMEFYDFPHIGNVMSSQLLLTPSFFRRVGLNHQPERHTLSLSHDGSMVLLYMVTFTYIYHQYTPVMLALIYQHHGSVMGLTSFTMTNNAIRNVRDGALRDLVGSSWALEDWVLRGSGIHGPENGEAQGGMLQIWRFLKESQVY